MRLRLAGIILLVVVGVAAVFVVIVNPGGSSSSSSTTYRTAAATRQDVTKSIVATGTVTPVSTYSLLFGTAPTPQTSGSSSASAASGSGSTTWKVLTINVAPGKVVKQGDTLATADTGSAQLAVTLAQANLTSAQQKLATDQGGLTATDKATAQLSVTQAQQSVTQAQQSYNSTVAQNNLKLSQQLAAINAANSKLATDQAAVPPSPATVAQDQSAVSSAQNAYDSLKLSVAQSNQQAANSITNARNQLTSAQLGYATKTAPVSAAQIASDQAAVATAQQSVDNAQTALQYATLTAPVDGTILTVNLTAGVNAPSGAAITMQSAAFQVSAAVAEADLPTVKLGQDATVTLTASGLTASGKVTQISPSGTAASGGGVVSYPILVSLPTPPAGTASGMSAQISVTITSVSQVIAVPSVALVGSAGSYSVRELDASGQPQLVAVTVGLITSSYAEIQSGVDVGTVVVVGTSSSRQGATTTGAGIGGGLGGGFGGGGGGGVRIPGGG